MRTLIALTLILTASLTNAQIVFEFDAESSGSNTIKNNWWGVTAEGTVTLSQGAQTVTVNIINTSFSGDISGFDFYDPISAPNTANTGWNLTSATTTGVSGNYNAWDDTSEVKWLGDGSYTGGFSDKYVGAEANYNADNWNFINWDRDPNEEMVFVFHWEGGGIYDMDDLVAAWDTGTADLRLRFQNVNGGSSNSAWHYDKFSTDLTRNTVPEPSTYGMIGAGALLLLVIRRRFKK